MKKIQTNIFYGYRLKKFGSTHAFYSAMSFDVIDDGKAEGSCLSESRYLQLIGLRNTSEPDTSQQK